MELYFNDITYNINENVIYQASLNEDDVQNAQPQQQTNTTNNQSTQNTKEFPQKEDLEKAADKVFNDENLTKKFLEKISKNDKNSSNIQNAEKIITELDTLNKLTNDLLINISTPIKTLSQNK